MYRVGYRKFYLALLIGYCFFGQLAYGLRCYQCKQGAKKLCTMHDIVAISCPTQVTQPTDGTAAPVTNCGYAQVPISYSTATAYTASLTLSWRGCITAASSSTTPLTAFSYYFLGVATGFQPVNAAFTYCSSPSDLCNKPRQCYRCAGGWDTVCNSFDTVLDECYDLSYTSCATAVVTSNTYSCSSGTCYWKGCLAPSTLTSLQSASPISTSTLTTAINDATNANALGFGSATNIASVTSITGCTTDGCNAGTRLASRLSYSFTGLLILIGLSFKS